MYGRRHHRKRSFKQIVVTVLTVAMMLSLCFPNLRASAGEIDEPVDNTAAFMARIDEIQSDMDHISTKDDYDNVEAAIKQLGEDIGAAQLDESVVIDFEAVSAAYAALEENFAQVTAPAAGGNERILLTSGGEGETTVTSSESSEETTTEASSEESRTEASSEETTTEASEESTETEKSTEATEESKETEESTEATDESTEATESEATEPSEEETTEPSESETTENTTVPSESTEATETTAATEPIKTHYEQLMEATSCEDIFNLMMADTDATTALTAEEVAKLTEKVEAMEDDGYKVDVQDTLVYLEEQLGGCTCGTTDDVHETWCPMYPIETYPGRPGGSGSDSQSSADLSVTVNITDAIVKYSIYDTTTGTWSELQPVTSGTPITKSPFVTSASAGYIVFFVKPLDETYLLTGMKVDNSSGYIYSIEEGDYSESMSGYPGLNDLAESAGEQGYIGLFGYSRTTTNVNSVNDTVGVVCVSPDIEVEAECNKTTDVKPGDELEFTVTVTPGEVDGAEMTDVEIRTISINGVEVAAENITKNADGTYTVKHIATISDCEKGSITLDVTAAVSYKGVLGVTNGDIETATTIVKSASTSCSIAPKNKVTYFLKYETGDVTIAEENYPDAIKNAPVDSATYYSGDSVTAVTYGTSPIVDTVNGGEWTFDGWYYNGEKVTQTTMTENGIVFSGTWTFKRTLCDVTITKSVKGNMGDWNKLFDFDMMIDGTGDTIDVDLKNGQTHTQTGVTLNSTIWIKETDANGYDITVTYKYGDDGEVKTVEPEGEWYKIAVKEGLQITFTNTKDATIDTGVSLNSYPFFLLLSTAIVGAFVLTVGKKRYRY